MAGVSLTQEGLKGENDLPYNCAMDSLKTKKEFDLVYKKGFRRYKDGFKLFVFSDKCLVNEVRLGLSVSKKIGNAVTRNLIKRRVKAIFYEIKSLLVGLHIVFVATTEIISICFGALKKDIIDCLDFILKRIKR